MTPAALLTAIAASPCISPLPQSERRQGCSLDECWPCRAREALEVPLPDFDVCDACGGDGKPRRDQWSATDRRACGLAAQILAAAAGDGYGLSRIEVRAICAAIQLLRAIEHRGQMKEEPVNG